MCYRLVPINLWVSMWCATCRALMPRRTLAYLTQTDAFCSRECAAIHSRQERHALMLTTPQWP